MSLVVLVLAAIRITRFVRLDKAGSPIRHLILGVFGWTAVLLRLKGKTTRGRMAAKDLISCPYCIGFWISLLCGFSWVLWGDTVVWLALMLPWALSWIVGLVSIWEEKYTSE